MATIHLSNDDLNGATLPPPHATPHAFLPQVQPLVLGQSYAYASPPLTQRTVVLQQDVSQAVDGAVEQLRSMGYYVKRNKPQGAIPPLALAGYFFGALCVLKGLSTFFLGTP